MGLAKKAARGEWTGGVAPFGYRYDSERGLLLPVEQEAAVVRAIFERYAERGEGSMSVARWLNERSERTRRASCWTPGRVICLLKNPTYLGLLPFHDQLHEAGHEPLVEREPFERAEALLRKRGCGPELSGSNPHRLPAHELPALLPLWARLHRYGRPRPEQRLSLLHLLLPSPSRDQHL